MPNLRTKMEHESGGHDRPFQGKLMVATTVLDRCGRQKAIHFVDVNALNDPAVGNRICAFRKQKGLSRHELAKRTGISREDVLCAENRPWDCPIGFLAKICGALGKTMYDLSESASRSH